MSARLDVGGAVVCAACLWAATLAGAAAEPAETRYSESVFTKGRSLEREKKYREAAVEYDAIALKYSEEGQPAKTYRLEALSRAAMAYFRTGQWPEAKQRHEKIVAAADSEDSVKQGDLSFRTTIFAYKVLMEGATRDKDYKRARELAEKGSKRLGERLVASQKQSQLGTASRLERQFQDWLVRMKPLFDWKIAHPDQLEAGYYIAIQRASAAKAKAVPTSWTALTRNSESATTGTCATSSCGCGCGTTTTTTATACCKP